MYTMAKKSIIRKIPNSHAKNLHPKCTHLALNDFIFNILSHILKIAHIIKPKLGSNSTNVYYSALYVHL